MNIHWLKITWITLITSKSIRQASYGDSAITNANEETIIQPIRRKNWQIDRSAQICHIHTRPVGQIGIALRDFASTVITNYTLWSQRDLKNRNARRIKNKQLSDEAMETQSIMSISKGQSTTSYPLKKTTRPTKKFLPAHLKELL